MGEVGQEVFVEELLDSLDLDTEDLRGLHHRDPVGVRVVGVVAPGVVLESKGLDVREDGQPA